MRSRIIKIVTAVISFIVVVGAIYLLVSKVNLANLFGKTTTIKGTTVVDKTGISASVDKIYDAVVMIQNYKNGSVYSTGTGFVYKKDSKYGYILTNYHVVAQTDIIKTILSNDEEVDAKYLGGDEYLDLAVIRIPADKVLLVAEMGNSDESKLGDALFTVGTPLGYEYRGTVTQGILSGKNRMVTVSVGNSSSEDYVMKVLQTDAAINPGNSGGPLVNISGKVIGINSMKLVQDEIEGMGFAIPIEYATAHINELENGKQIERPYLGVSLINASDTSALYRYGFNNISSKTGVLVAEIQDGSGASKSDLKKGDIIIKIADEKVNSIAYLRYELFKHTVGDKINVTYLRDGKEKTTKVILGKEK